MFRFASSNIRRSEISMRNASLFKRFMLLLLAVSLFAYGEESSFTLTDMQGKTHTLAGHKGKWVLVNLWATWCVPCLTEMPELEALNKSRDDLVILGIAVDGQNPRRVAQFAEKMHVTYPIVLGNDDSAKHFKARGYPTSILYDPSGKQILFKEGVITRKEIESTLHYRP